MLNIGVTSASFRVDNLIQSLYCYIRTMAENNCKSYMGFSKNNRINEIKSVLSELSSISITSMKSRFIFLISAVLYSTIVACNQDSLLTQKVREYDEKTGQTPVLTHNKLDAILSKLSKIHSSILPAEYVEYSMCGEYAALKYKEYYVLKGEDVFKYVAGHFRIMDFMSKDSFFKVNLDSLPQGINQYWLMDARVLHKFLDLLGWMHGKGYNDSALSINNGHRHPAYNKEKGGVSRSYHMQGMAIDIKVGDINRDGAADGKDKRLILDILETKIIGAEGGLGKYPRTDVIHFDVRGHRARWDSHK